MIICMHMSSLTTPGSLVAKAKGFFMFCSCQAPQNTYLTPFSIQLCTQEQHLLTGSETAVGAIDSCFCQSQPVRRERGVRSSLTVCVYRNRQRGTASCLQVCHNEKSQEHWQRDLRRGESGLFCAAAMNLFVI